MYDATANTSKVITRNCDTAPDSVTDSVTDSGTDPSTPNIIPTDNTTGINKTKTYPTILQKIMSSKSLFYGLIAIILVTVIFMSNVDYSQPVDY
jgi:hypothetical protein